MVAIGAANAAWGSSYSSFNNLLPALGNGQFNWSGAAADMKDFYAHLADTYYSEFRAAMKSVAPNKLYLGSRIYEGTMTNEVVSAAAAHCDVVSFNIYHKDLYEFQRCDSR
jgi:agarase